MAEGACLTVAVVQGLGHTAQANQGPYIWKCSIPLTGGTWDVEPLGRVLCFPGQFWRPTSKHSIGNGYMRSLPVLAGQWMPQGQHAAMVSSGINILL